MSKSYDDSRYGIEKILTLPTMVVSSGSIGSAFTLDEDWTLVEFGAWCTTSLLSAAVSAQISINKSAAALTQLGTLTLLSNTIIGWVKSTTTLSTTQLASGDVMVIRLETSNGAGAVTPYLRYKERVV